MNRILLVFVLDMMAASVAAQESFHDGFFAASRFDDALGEEISNFDGGNGFVVEGAGAFDQLGFSVAGAGDFNGDGFDDLILGAPTASPAGIAQAGAAYVLFGAAEGFAPTVDLTALDGINGFAIHDDALGGDHVGARVGAAGDLNDDGLDDLAVYSEGKVIVVYGRATTMPALLATSAIDATRGAAIATRFRTPSTIGSAGDVNGDGVDDLVVGTFGGATSFGIPARSYVVFGSSTGLAAGLDLTTLDGTNGFAIGNSGVSFETSQVASGAGDVNGDGRADLIIGQRQAGVSGAGEAYVVFGADGGFPALVDEHALDGGDGFALRSTSDDLTGVGLAVAGGGDLNGDGLDDLVVGAPNYDFTGFSFSDRFYARGQALAVFGSIAGFPASFDLSTLDGDDGFQLHGDCGIAFPFNGSCESLDGAGYAVSGLGDLNGDGLDDLLVGAPGYSDASAEAYVLFGSADGFAGRIDVGSTDSFGGASNYQGRLDGRNGFAIEIPEHIAFAELAVSGAGDFNGDGLADVVIGLPDSGDGGRVYVLFGRRAVPEPSAGALLTAVLVVQFSARRRWTVACRPRPATDAISPRGSANSPRFAAVRP